MTNSDQERKAADSASAVDGATLQDEPAEKGSEQGSEQPADEAVVSYLTGLKLLLVMTGVTLVMFLAMLDIAIISTAIPMITSDFHRLEDVGWYIGAYQLASATIQPLTGKLFTHFNLKWTYLVFLTVFEIGSAVCGAASSSTMLIIGRAVAGLGASGLMNGTLTVVLAACTPKVRPMYTGLAMGVSQLGIVLGPLLGGVFTDHVSWRWCFYINLPVGGVAALFLAAITIPEQTPKTPLSIPFLRSILPRFDLIGFALFAPASIMLLLALQFGAGDYAWNSSQVIGLFCGAGATALVFVFWERRKGDDAMVPFSMVRRRVIWTSCLNFALLMTMLVVGSSFMPIYLQSVKGLSPTMSGVYLLASILSQLLFVIVSGALVGKLGYYVPFALFASGIGCIGCGLISTWSPSTSLGKLIGYQIILGGRGAGIQIPVIAIQTALPAKDVAVGNSILVFSQNFINAVFVTVGNTIFQEILADGVLKVPGISPAEAIEAGGSAEAVRALAPAGPARDALFEAYSDGFKYVFYLLVGTCGIAFFMAFGMGWVDLRKKEETKKGEV